MPVPDYQSLILPVLRCAAEGVVTVADCLEKMAPALGLTEEDKAQLLPSGKQTVFANRTHWAKFYMTRAGLVEVTQRGHFRITERGRALLAENPPRIDNAFLERYPEFAEWMRRNREAQQGSAGGQGQGAAIATSATATPEELMDSNHATLVNGLRNELLERVRQVTPAFFEQLIVDLLVAMGYGGGRAEMAARLGKPGDGGIDGVINEDALGLDVVYVQAKRYAAENQIGREAIQSFVGSLDAEGATKGVFVTTSSFSKPAREYVTRTSKRIVLIDGDELASLMIKHNVGVRVRNVYEVKRVDEDYFSE